MNEIPNFLRTEVWHALSVHFPIVLLFCATILYVISLVLYTKGGKQWLVFASSLLYAGTISAWLGVYTGDLADGIVSRTICDPTVLKQHEINAYLMSYIFTAVSVIDLIINVGYFSDWVKPLRFIAAAGMITGVGFLVNAGHLGASLVYQQGAGVYQPSENCSEFD